MKTLQERFQDFSREARREGVAVRRNVMACCQSCADFDTHGRPANFWSFGGQGHYVTIRDNEAYATVNKYGFKDFIDIEKIGFNHEGLVTREGSFTEVGEKFFALAIKNGIVFEKDDDGFRSSKKLYVDVKKSIEMGGDQ